VETRATKRILGVFVALVLAFLYIPIVVISLYAFNDSNVQSWPRPRSPSTVPLDDPQRGHADGAQDLARGCDARDNDRARPRLAGGVRRAPLPLLRPRVRVVPVRLPIALPGIITGMALSSYFTYWAGISASRRSSSGHATFCVVIVYNNVLARLRRVPGSLAEASMTSARTASRPSGS